MTVPVWRYAGLAAPVAAVALMVFLIWRGDAGTIKLLLTLVGGLVAALLLMGVVGGVAAAVTGTKTSRSKSRSRKIT
jgi:uncharacterized membrane protein